MYVTYVSINVLAHSHACIDTHVYAYERVCIYVLHTYTHIHTCIVMRTYYHTLYSAQNLRVLYQIICSWFDPLQIVVKNMYNASSTPGTW